MKMRKLIALVMAVMMLFCIIPAGAVSAVADANVIENTNFDDGEKNGWSSSSAISVEDGVLVFNVTQDWGNIYKYSRGMKANTDYVYTFRAKANMSNTMNIFVNDNWGKDTAHITFDVTTEWQEFTVDVNSGDYQSAAILLFSANGPASTGLVFYLDYITITEGTSEPEVPSEPDEPVAPDEPDGNLIVNGGFETGDAAGWRTWQSTEINADAAYNGNYGLHIKNPTGGWGGTAFQDFNVTVGKTYEVTMWVKNLDGARGQNIQIQNGGATVASKWFDNTTTWTLLTFEFTATAENCRINICGGGTSANEELYVDDIKVEELIDPSFDGYIYNGDFETGKLAPWHDKYLSSGSYEIVEGYEGGSALYINAPKQWGHIRQDGIAVEANTTYRLTALVKNAQNMAFVIKKGDDSGDLTPGDADHAIPAGEDWQLYELEFNTGYDKDGNAIDIDSICVLVISYEADGSVIIDNVKLEKVEDTGCQHEYFYPCDKICMLCWEETNPDADHSIKHVEAKPAASCIEYGNIEYWYCEHCGAAWQDEDLVRFTNLRAVVIAGECVSDSPACKDGVCINCTLPCPAEAEHTYDNDYDATCNACGDIREVEAIEIVYGDANGDGEVTTRDVTLLQQYMAGWDVTLVVESADANGDGEVTTRDVTLLQQFMAGWEVTLGPV